MSFHVRQDETLSPEGLAKLQRAKLARVLDEVARGSRFYQNKYDGFDLEAIGREATVDAALGALPLTTRAEIQEDQQASPPFGTILSRPVNEYTRLHQTSGSTGVPLRFIDRPEDWAWWKHCWSIVYRAGGLTPEDRCVFPFSFGPFVGFWAAFEAAAAMGNLCLPAGGMTTRARLDYLLENEATFVCCTPTYALHMAEAAREAGIDLAASRVRALIVAGEPGGSIPATRERIESEWGARVLDHAGMTEVGPYAFECIEAPGGLHVIESEFIAEVIDPHSLQPVAAGHPGELVLTNLGRLGCPLIRYRTGDLVQRVRSRCACGRSFARLVGGILGRIDDMVTIRGNNVFPGAIEAILREHSGIVEFQLQALTDGALAELRIDLEPAPGMDVSGLPESVARAVKDRLNFRPTVRLVAPGSLPRFEMKAKRWIRTSGHVENEE